MRSAGSLNGPLFGFAANTVFRSTGNSWTSKSELLLKLSTSAIGRPCVIRSMSPLSSASRCVEISGMIEIFTVSKYGCSPHQSALRFSTYCLPRLNFEM